MEFINQETKNQEIYTIDSRAHGQLPFQPPTEGSIDVELTITYGKKDKPSLELKSLKKVQVSTSGAFDFTYGLPEPWCRKPELIALFKNVRKEFRDILLHYLRNAGLQEQDVRLMFEAAEKNYSLAFKNEAEFKGALESPRETETGRAGRQVPERLYRP